jgi:hypothetical protein
MTSVVILWLNVATGMGMHAAVVSLGSRHTEGYICTALLSK